METDHCDNAKFEKQRMRQKKRNKRLEHNFRWIKTKTGHTKIDDNIPWKRAKHIDSEFL